MSCGGKREEKTKENWIKDKEIEKISRKEKLVSLSLLQLWSLATVPFQQS